MTDPELDMKMMVSIMTLRTMRRLTSEYLTIWHHIENATIALQALIESPQCTDDEDVYDETLALVRAYDALLRKVTVKQIKNEEMKNESL